MDIDVNLFFIICYNKFYFVIIFLIFIYIILIIHRNSILCIKTKTMLGMSGIVPPVHLKKIQV